MIYKDEKIDYTEYLKSQRIRIDITNPDEKAARKKERLKYEFEDTYNEWCGKYTDDRMIFCNTYEILLETYEAMSTITSVYIWAACEANFYDDFELLTKILEKYDNDSDE